MRKAGRWGGPNLRHAARGLAVSVLLTVTAAGPARAQLSPCSEAMAPANACSFQDDVPGQLECMGEAVCEQGIMAACGPSSDGTAAYFCPGEFVTREDMAVHLERALRGSTYAPPSPTSAPFLDVSVTYCLAGWIKKLAEDQITAGCGDGNYCPFAAVSRAQMAIFIAKTVALKWGVSIPASGIAQGCAFNCVPGGTSCFSDVQPSEVWCPHIHFMYARCITAGCGSGLFCSNSPVRRDQMAVFLWKAFLRDSPGPPVCPGRNCS